MKNKKENDYHERRAVLTKAFFKKWNIEVELLGDYNAPLIVTQDNVALSCYLHNFNLVFMDSNHNAKEVFRVKLNASLFLVDYSEMLIEWFNSAQHRKLFFIKLNDLFYHRTAYCFTENHPLWVQSKSLAFYVFSQKRASDIISQFYLLNNEIYFE